MKNYREKSDVIQDPKCKKRRFTDDEDDDVDTALALGSTYTRASRRLQLDHDDHIQPASATFANSTPPQQQLQRQPQSTAADHLQHQWPPSSSPLALSNLQVQQPSAAESSTRGRPRKGRNSGSQMEKTTVAVRYPWGTTQPAKVQSLAYLESNGILEIRGEVQCKRCDQKYEIGFDLKREFYKVGSFLAENKSSMRERAPPCWTNPVLPTCKLCKHENSAKPVIAVEHDAINWLFLLLGQLLGCCTLDQLKYFCRHTENHRTGAKDRLLYLTYLRLCHQLDPTGPFQRS